MLASLYHLVTPGDFGLIGMALPVIMFLRIFTSLGMISPRCNHAT